MISTKLQLPKVENRERWESVAQCALWRDAYKAVLRVGAFRKVLNKRMFPRIG